MDFSEWLAFRLGGTAEPGTYDNVITGLDSDPGNVASWTIETPGFTGNFTNDGAGNIDLIGTDVPLQITAITRLTNGDILLEGTGLASSVIKLQSAPDPNNASSGADIPVNVAADGTWAQTDPAPGEPQKFYRAVFP